MAFNDSTFSGNETSYSCFDREDSTAVKTGKTLAYCLLLLVSLTGNVLIIMVVHKDRGMRTTTNFLIVNMAISDLLVPVFAMPRAIVEIHYGNLRWLIDGQLGLTLCKLTSFFQDISTAVSVQSLVVISLDRFYAVSRPFKAAIAKTKVKKAIPLIWFLATLIHACYLYGFQLRESQGKTYCYVAGWSPSFSKILFAFLILVIYFIPLSITTTLYSLIVRKLREQNIYGIQSVVFHRQRVRQNRAVLRMSIAIVAVFFLSLSPFVIYLSIDLFSKKRFCGSRDFRFYSQYLVHCHGVLNFFTYAVFCQRYRRGFRGILSQCLSPCKDTCPNHKAYQVTSPNSQTTHRLTVGTTNVGFEAETRDVKLLQLTRLDS